MKMMLRLVLLMTWACFCAPVARAQHVMSLRECVEKAISNNLDLKVRNIEISKSGLAIEQARARKLPQVGASWAATDYLISPVTVTGGTLLGQKFPDDITWQKVRSMPYQSGGAVNGTIPLVDLTIKAAEDVASSMRELSVIGRDKAIETLTMQLARVYYLAQITRQQSLLTQDNIARMEDLCAIAEALYNKGVALEIDVSRVRINLKNLQVALIRHRTLYGQQLNMLRFLMNMGADEPLEVAPADTCIGPAAPEGVCTELPELRLNAQRQQLVEKQIRQVRTGYWPKLSLVGGVGYSVFADKVAHPHWFGNAAIGLRLTVPLLDAHQKRNSIRQLRLDGSRLSAERELAMSSLRREHDDGVMQMAQNREVFYAQKQSYRLAQDVYDVAKEKYKEGVAPMTEVLQDEMNLRNAYTECLNALFQYKCARLTLLRLAGRLDDLDD